MTDHAAIDMLSKEHKIILQVVLGLHGLAGHLREGRRVDVELLREAVDFMREFADKCHHAKEEELLFPALVAHGVPLHGCPLDVICPPLSGPETMIVWTTKGTMNAEQEAQAGRDYREAA